MSPPCCPERPAGWPLRPRLVPLPRAARPQACACGSPVSLVWVSDCKQVMLSFPTTSSFCPHPSVPWAGGPLHSLSCHPGGGWGPSGEGLGAHCTFVSPRGLLSASPSPLLCPHRAPRSRADTDTISPTQSCQLRDRGHGQPLRGNGRSCVCWELAVGSGGCSLHISDSSCCSPPEDRGAGGVCSPGPLPEGAPSHSPQCPCAVEPVPI